MKRIFSLILMICLLLLSSASAFAEDRVITVNINGQKLESPVPARIVNGRTVLPMRSIFERLGATVSWIAEDRLIFATANDTFIAMQIDNYNLSVQKTSTNENQIIKLDVAPFIDNGHTLVPVRAVAETLNARVDWDPVTYTVDIFK